MDQKTLSAASLPFFGIPRLVPYMKKYRRTLILMIVCGLLGTAVDLVLPLLQRYALNHFIARKTLDTARAYTLAQLGQMARLCLDTEYLVKSGQLMDAGSLEKVMLQILSMREANRYV